MDQKIIRNVLVVLEWLASTKTHPEAVHQAFETLREAAGVAMTPEELKFYQSLTTKEARSRYVFLSHDDRAKWRE
jgi:hypothetical protein